MLDKQAIRKLVEGWFSGKKPEVAARLALAEPVEMIEFTLEFVATLSKKAANGATSMVLLKALEQAVIKATKKRDEIQAQAAKYNGWTNYETWAVHQWLTAAGSGAEIRHQAKVTDSIADLPTKLYDYFNDMVLAKDGPSWRSDLLVKGLGRVNWDELAEALRQ